MADKIDLERAVDEMLSDLAGGGGVVCAALPLDLVFEEDEPYWEAEYWIIKDKYDTLVDQIETLVRKYTNG